MSGAGYAGVLTAKKLEKRLRKNRDVEISIVDKNPFHTMLTELHEVAANRVDEHNIRLSLKKIFAGRKVNVIQDKITDIDFNGKTASGLNGSYRYDYLVVATGSRPAFYGVGRRREEFPHPVVIRRRGGTEGAYTGLFPQSVAGDGA